MLYHIVAVAKNYVIGKEGRLPWEFEEIPKCSRKMTAGSTVILGRRAYENLGGVFSDCEKFVLSKSHPVGGENPRYFGSLGDALGAVKTKNVFIGGGEELYRETFSCADGVYVIRIDEDYEGDAFYPPLPGTFIERFRISLREDPRIETVFYENAPAKGCQCRGGEPS